MHAPPLQVHGIAPSVRLVTLDADGTLYADGQHIEQDNAMIGQIISLMISGVHVAIVTAAGYPGDAGRFEMRVKGLLDAFRSLRLDSEVLGRFHIIGGECNYLLRCRDDYRLAFVPDDSWKSPAMLQWSESDIKQLLDEAQSILEDTAVKLKLPVEARFRQNLALTAACAHVTSTPTPVGSCRACLATPVFFACVCRCFGRSEPWASSLSTRPCMRYWRSSPSRCRSSWGTRGPCPSALSTGATMSFATWGPRPTAWRP